MELLWQDASVPFTNLTIAEEVLSLSPGDREALARLLIQSLESAPRSGPEITAELNARLHALLSREDKGMAFKDVFDSTAVNFRRAADGLEIAESSMGKKSISWKDFKSAGEEGRK